MSEYIDAARTIRRREVAMVVAAVVLGILGMLLSVADDPAGAHKRRPVARAASLNTNETVAWNAIKSHCGKGTEDGVYCKNRVESWEVDEFLYSCHGGGYRCWDDGLAYQERCRSNTSTCSTLIEWDWKAVHLHVRISDHVLSYYDECVPAWECAS